MVSLRIKTKMVEAGLEPASSCEHMVLSHACLPIPPPDRKVRSTGLEPVTLCSEGRCSIQLSYERKVKNVDRDGLEPSTCRLRGECSTIELAVLKIQKNTCPVVESNHYVQLRRLALYPLS